MPCELMFGGMYSPLDRMDDASFRRPRGWSQSLLPTTFFCPPHSSEQRKALRCVACIYVVDGREWQRLGNLLSRSSRPSTNAIEH